MSFDGTGSFENGNADLHLYWINIRKGFSRASQKTENRLKLGYILKKIFLKEYQKSEEFSEFLKIRITLKM